MFSFINRRKNLENQVQYAIKICILVLQKELWLHAWASLKNMILLNFFKIFYDRLLIMGEMHGIACEQTLYWVWLYTGSAPYCMELRSEFDQTKVLLVTYSHARKSKPAERRDRSQSISDTVF